MSLHSNLNLPPISPSSCWLGSAVRSKPYSNVFFYSPTKELRGTRFKIFYFPISLDIEHFDDTPWTSSIKMETIVNYRLWFPRAQKRWRYFSLCSKAHQRCTHVDTAYRYRKPLCTAPTMGAATLFWVDHKSRTDPTATNWTDTTANNRTILMLESRDSIETTAPRAARCFCSIAKRYGTNTSYPIRNQKWTKG